MKQRILGKSGISVSSIGFGAWGIGGAQGDAVAYGKTDDATSLRALQVSLEQGVTFYDVADLYGNGHAEELLGQAFEHHRDQVVLASKVGFKGFSGERDLSPAYIEQALAASLKRLRTDYLDLYQIHSPSDADFARWPEVLETLQDLKKRGLIKAIGLAAKGPDDGLAYLQTHDFDVVQVNFNLADQRAKTNGLFAYCQTHNIGLIARTPFCFGFLTGKVPSDMKFAPGDHRAKWSAEQIRLWAEAFQRFSLDAMLGEGQSQAQLALRFCISYPEVACVIPGTMNEREAVENASVGDLPLLAADILDRIETIYKNHLFFAG